MSRWKNVCWGIASVVAGFSVLANTGQADSAVWVQGPSMQEAHGNLGGAVDNQGRIYAIGGRVDSFVPMAIDGKVECYDPAAGSWAYVASLNTPRAYLGAAKDLAGRIYAIGGIISSSTGTNVVERYDPNAGVWSYVRGMNTDRAFSGVATDLSGRIYAIGGNSRVNGNDTSLSSVERYDPVTNQWSFVQSLPQAISFACATSDANGRIYVIGGYHGTSYLNTVLRYDPEIDTWSELDPISSSRSVAAAVTGLDGLIYAISGYGGGYTSEVQIYNPATESWLPGPSVLEARNNSGAAAAPNGDIYLFGGDIGYYRTNSVEILQIPEPVTLSLLALGGLALLRCKYYGK